MSKIVMALSGGMDSGTMLAKFINDNHEVYCLNFTYGSKHNKYEIQCAQKLADYYQVSYRLIDLTEAFKGFKSNLLSAGGDIPEGHYEQSNMALTVVPGRNTIFASILMGYAESINAEYIALGVHKGDHAIYPDCRTEYVKALDNLVYLASDKKIQVISPFSNMDKTDICRVGLTLNVPYEITRTCYKNQEFSCGKCGACTERLESFKLNNAVDPIKYKD
jgi:7-cyano-7-deazaguanine synthase